MGDKNDKKRNERGSSSSLKGKNGEGSPSHEQPAKRLRDSEKECSKCHADPGQAYIRCLYCNLIFCQKCCKLAEVILRAYVIDAESIPGIDWKCSSCSVTSNAFMNMNQKLDTMESNNKDRMESMDKKLEGMEQRITDKVISEIPGMIKSEIEKMETTVHEKMEKNVKEAETKITRQMQKEVKAVSDRLDEARGDMIPKEEVSKMIKDALDKNREEMRKEIPTTHSGPPPKPQMSPGTLLRSAVAEMKEREKRENRIVIYKLEEEPTRLRTERVEKDKNKLIEIASDVMAIKNLTKKEIIQAERLGEKKEGIARPLLVEFSTNDRTDLIMRKANRLRDSDYDHISITYDMTPKEREQQKKLVVEAKKKQESEGGRWLYKVRGPPWAMKIIRKEGRAATAQGQETEKQEKQGTSMEEDKE